MYNGTGMQAFQRLFTIIRLHRKERRHLMRKSLSLLLALLLALSLAMPVYAAEAESVEVLTQALDYNDKENWA